MRRIMKATTAVFVFALVVAVDANAGLFDKKSDCGETCQSACCAPTISRPRCANVMCYQRKCSVVKPACCPSTCAAPNCCAPLNCDETYNSDCAVPAGCGQGTICPLDGSTDRCCNSNCTNEGCCDSASRCEIADLIRESMTACYARQRRNAVHHLGDYYDCCCHPEIMNALVYALNDSDERVRAKAADEIGDQFRRNRNCCTSDVICALRYSLGDCDRSVRRQAEEALQVCGYRIVDGSCCETQQVYTEQSLPPSQNDNADPDVAPVPLDDTPVRDELNPVPVPAPAVEELPPTETEVPAVSKSYFPTRLHREYRPQSQKGLAAMFGVSQ